MVGRFFITGLPRSRTAWLSLACDMVHGAVCYHEPLRELSRWDDVGAIWGDPKAQGFVGVSDSGLGLHLGEILAQFGPRTLIVQRSMGEVIVSLLAAGFGVSAGVLSILQRRLDVHTEHPLVKVVAFRDLDQIDVVLDALEHLMPGAYVDRDRLARLMGMNVQASAHLALEAARRRKVDISDLLGLDVMDELRSLEKA